MRDISGKYLSNDEVLAIKSFILKKAETKMEIPTITNIHFIDGFYKTEFIENGKNDISYLEIPDHWVKSFIRDLKINRLKNGYKDWCRNLFNDL